MNIKYRVDHSGLKDGVSITFDNVDDALKYAEDTILNAEDEDRRPLEVVINFDYEEES